MITEAQPVGTMLRQWRQRRSRSQLDLACEAEISTKHLSFLETGRAQPSREMLLHLAELLDVPLRERNSLLLSAGFAPTFRERSLDDPALSSARRAVDLVLQGHEPYPAIAVDRHWTLVASNRALAPLLAGITPALVTPPINVLRLSLHPGGLAPRIVNHAEWREHLLVRLRRQIDSSADPVLAELHRELAAYPVPSDEAAPARTSAPRSADGGYGGVVIPLQLRTAAGVLSLFSTITVFGTPVDITLSELAIEAFFPADQATGDALRQAAAA
ncbi:MAG TPA: helix-turn-helix transcriptional regulator [Candidatus Limnocylindrales bacterium]|jgi:transcriptional regulator with XRE-family HTH domain|nr:helix-turn-helix transcriptional regulator [Candidatus Limnocylindrales bacterium]